MKVLVTGATGRVGGLVVDGLLARGHAVRALTRTPEKATLPEGVEIVGGDLADPASLDGVFDDVDAAHLLAVGADGVDDPAALVRAVLDRARDAGVRRLTGLDGLGSVPLCAGIVERGGTNVAGVEFMSNALWWADDVRARGVVRDALAERPSDVVHEADLAEVTVEVLLSAGEHDGQTVVVTGPEALTVHQRAAILGEALGRPLTVEVPSREEAIAEWRSWGFDDETIAQFLAASDAGDHPLSPADRITGRPVRTFAQWAIENAEAFQ